MLHRRVYELLDISKGHDVVEFSVDLRLPHSQDRTVQVDVLPSRKLTVKPCSHLEQGTEPAVNLRPSFRRLGDAGEDLQKRALAGAVFPNDSYYVTPLDLEGNVS